MLYANRRRGLDCTYRDERALTMVICLRTIDFNFFQKKSSGEFVISLTGQTPGQTLKTDFTSGISTPPCVPILSTRSRQSMSTINDSQTLRRTTTTDNWVKRPREDILSLQASNISQYSQLCYNPFACSIHFSMNWCKTSSSTVTCAHS